MYNNEEIAAEIEELLFDFLTYRKARRNKAYTAQNKDEADKGWKYYTWPEDSAPEETHIATLSEQELSALMPPATQPPVMKPTLSAENLPQPSPLPLAEYHTASYIGGTLPPPLNLNNDEDFNDIGYMEHLMSDISQKVLPTVRQILNDYEYEGSPAYGTIDKETLAQMVDKVLDKAKELLEENEAVLILRALVETAILGELFYKRRLNKRNSQ